MSQTRLILENYISVATKKISPLAIIRRSGFTKIFINYEFDYKLKERFRSKFSFETMHIFILCRMKQMKPERFSTDCTF